MKLPLVGLVTATTVSSVGTGMTMLAIPWFVLASTGRGVDTALVVMAETTGLLLGSAFCGPWVDLLRPRRAAVVFDLAAALVVLGVPVLDQHEALPLWGLCSLGLLLGFSRAPGDTARQVLIPDIAVRTGIAVERVNTAFDAPNQAARALGAPIIGAVKAERTPPAYRARVFSALTAAALLGMPLGTLAAGLLNDHIGLMSTIAVFAAASTAMSVCPLVFPAWRDVDEHASATSDEFAVPVSRE